MGSTPGNTWKEKRRSDRLDVADDEKVLIRVLVRSQGDAGRTIDGVVRTVSVRNCSVHLSTGEAKRFQAGLVCSATLIVDGAAVPMQVEVARVIAPDEVALKFKPPYPPELKKLEKFLEPRFLGRSLREIDPSQLQQKEGNRMRWFQGASETGPFSWSDPANGRVVQQQLVFLGRVVEWNKSGVRTGRVQQEISTPGHGWVKADLLAFDDAPELELLGQIRIFLKSAKIDESVKKAFLEKLK